MTAPRYLTLMRDDETPKELSLEEKITLAKESGNTVLLNRLLEIKAEQDSKIIFPTEQDWENQINTWAQEESRKLGFKPGELNFRIFVHGSNDDRQWKVIDGVVVHIHYFGRSSDVWQLVPDVNGKEFSPFWRSLRSVIRMVPKLQRSTSIEVRNVMWTRHLEFTPDWKKSIVNGIEKEFDLIPDRNCTTTETITITKTHRRTKQSVTVSGDVEERYSLEREALVILSRKVFEYDEANDK